jgi:hypothetical protein
MDTQAVVDKVLKHLWDQGKASTYVCIHEPNIGGCAYRGMDGTKCAIGILIPDDIYSFDMEGKSFHELCRKHEAVANLPEIQAIMKVGEVLQQLHDTLQGTSDFRKRLRNRAQEWLDDYGLTVNLPQE